MNIGTLAEQYLTHSVLPHIHKQNKDTVVGAGVGNDYSQINDMITADGVGDTPEVAWHKAMNNFLCSGGEMLGARITLLLPAGVKDSHIKKCMEAFEVLSQKFSISISGGHSEVSAAYARATYVVTMYGKAADWRPDKHGIGPETQIVMAGYAGVLGNDQIIQKCHETLQKIFSEAYLEQQIFGTEAYSNVKPAALIMEKEICANAHVYYMHDISYGGVYAALWQLGKWMDKGFLVDNRSIPVRQGTIELCEALELNPYLIDGTGALLAVCDKGTTVVEALEKNGIPAQIIGTVTEGKEKLVQYDVGEVRTLTPVTGDDLEKIK